LERFANLEISLNGLREALKDVVQFDFGERQRELSCHFLTPKRGIRVEVAHIHRAMHKHALDQLSTHQLADWATMLLLNDAYDWEGPDEEEIATLLHDISALTLRPNNRD
jgi:hypothetical protein